MKRSNSSAKKSTRCAEKQWLKCTVLLNTQSAYILNLAAFRTCVNPSPLECPILLKLRRQKMKKVRAILARMTIGLLHQTNIGHNKLDGSSLPNRNAHPKYRLLSSHHLHYQHYCVQPPPHTAVSSKRTIIAELKRDIPVEIGKSLVGPHQRPMLGYILARSMR